MSKHCSICGKHQEFDVCEFCWYGMRLDPKKWKAELKKKGIEVKYQGGCVPIGWGIICRDPYVRKQ